MPLVTLPTTCPPMTSPDPKSLKNNCTVIGKALERLKLSVAEQEAWVAVKKHLERGVSKVT